MNAKIFLAIEKNGVSYFPSPLLESFLEWLVLFIILFFVYKYKKFHGQVAAIFLIALAKSIEQRRKVF